MISVVYRIASSFLRILKLNPFPVVAHFPGEIADGARLFAVVFLKLLKRSADNQMGSGLQLRALREDKFDAFRKRPVREVHFRTAVVENLDVLELFRSAGRVVHDFVDNDVVSESPCGKKKKQGPKRDTEGNQAKEGAHSGKSCRRNPESQGAFTRCTLPLWLLRVTWPPPEPTTPRNSLLSSFPAST